MAKVTSRWEAARVGLDALEQALIGAADQINNALAMVLLNVQYVDDLVDALAENGEGADASRVIGDIVAGVLRIRDVVRERRDHSTASAERKRIEPESSVGAASRGAQEGATRGIDQADFRACRGRAVDREERSDQGRRRQTRQRQPSDLVQQDAIRLLDVDARRGDETR